MVNSYQNKKALLVGNGVNRLDSSQSFSWHAILEAVNEKYRFKVDLDNDFKPFPLAFDEMLHQTSGPNNFSEKIKILKQNISQSIIGQLDGKNGFNFYHKKLTSLTYNDILTTNYDYSLQNSLNPKFKNLKNKLAINRQERKYSLKRAYSVLDKTIWHLHGELFDSRVHSDHSKYYMEESIMIGYEHYTAYLEKIQDNVKGKSGSQKIAHQSLMIRLRNGETSPYWIDIFFTHNVDIIGQGFDFSENHLWWLINYRSNAIRTAKRKHELIINNKIRFFYPDISITNQINTDEINELIKKKNSIQKSKAIAEVLKAFHVEPIPIKAISYSDFYDQLINRELIN